MAFFAPTSLVQELLAEHSTAAWVRMFAPPEEDACYVQVVDVDGNVLGQAQYTGTMPITRDTDAGA